MKVYRSRQAGLRIRDTYDKLLKEWGCEVKERDITVSYGTTHVIEWGDENSAPLVLFHGVGDDSALMWIYNAEYLGRYFHVYAIDSNLTPMLKNYPLCKIIVRQLFTKISSSYHIRRRKKGGLICSDRPLCREFTA